MTLHLVRSEPRPLLRKQHIVVRDLGANVVNADSEGLRTADDGGLNGVPVDDRIA